MTTDLIDRYAALDPVTEAGPALLETADLFAVMDGRTTLMATHDTITPQSLRSPRGPLLAAAVAAIAVVTVVAALLVVDFGGGEVQPASPAPTTVATALSATEREALDVFNRYTAATNSRDIYTTMSLFTEDSVINRSGVVLSGLDAIRSQHETDFYTASGDAATTVSNVEVLGNTVTWDLTIETRDVGSWCADGAWMTIEDGAIVELNLATARGCIVGGGN